MAFPACKTYAAWALELESQRDKGSSSENFDVMSSDDIAAASRMKDYDWQYRTRARTKQKVNFSLGPRLASIDVKSVVRNKIEELAKLKESAAKSEQELARIRAELAQRQCEFSKPRRQNEESQQVIKRFQGALQEFRKCSTDSNRILHYI